MLSKELKEYLKLSIPITKLISRKVVWIYSSDQMRVHIPLWSCQNWFYHFYIIDLVGGNVILLLFKSPYHKLEIWCLFYYFVKVILKRNSKVLSHIKEIFYQKKGIQIIISTLLLNSHSPNMCVYFNRNTYLVNHLPFGHGLKQY